MNADYRVSAFVGNNAEGAPHALYLRADLDQAAALKALSRTRDETLVLVAIDGVEPSAGVRTEPSAGLRTGPSASAYPTPVRFFAKGHEVLRCGSGTLAAAWALLKPQAQTRNRQTATHLSTAVETVQVLKADDAYGYTSTPLPQSDLPNRPLWEGIVRASIVDGALCGQATDYLIAELESEKALVKATPDLPALTYRSQRALILTAQTPNGYVLRYFAPQHGILEASATGSANIQLLRYWYHRNQRERQLVRQCSKPGAEFWGLPGPGAVQLFGKVRPFI